MEPVLPKHMAKCHSCHSLTPSRLKYHLLVGNQNRVVFRSDDQSWLGRAIIYPKQHFSTPDEFVEAQQGVHFLDLYRTRKKLDNVYQTCFDMEYSNWAQLGNLTLNEKGEPTTEIRYQHVHYHYIPRYRKYKVTPKEFAGFNFYDKRFGKALNIDPEQGHVKVRIPMLVMKLIKDRLQQALIEKGLIHNPNEILDSAPSVETINLMARKNLCKPIAGCEITLVRHGSTDWNKPGEEKLQGITDISLNDEGINQAKYLGEHVLNHAHFNAAYASAMKRALTTGEFILGKKALPITQTALLNEATASIWEGKLKSEYEQWCSSQPQPKIPSSETGDSYSGDEEISNFLKHKFEPTYESIGEVYTRFNEFLNQYASKHIGQKILVVGHGGTIRSVLEHWYFTPEYAPVVGNCAVVKLFYGEGKLSVSSIESVTWKERHPKV